MNKTLQNLSSEQVGGMLAALFADYHPEGISVMVSAGPDEVGLPMCIVGITAPAPFSRKKIIHRVTDHAAQHLDLDLSQPNSCAWNFDPENTGDTNVTSGRCVPPW